MPPFPKFTSNAVAASVAIAIAAATPTAPAADHVIAISIDGLRPAAIETLGPTGTPTFHRLKAEGTWTHNARTDYDWTYTVPNHSTMVTARPVVGAAGHNYTSNGTPASTTTYHSVKGSYVASLFDVAHDGGTTTAFYYNKTKLVIIEQSYDATSGAPDTTGADNGRDKIDFTESSSANTGAAISALYTTDLATHEFALSFVHFVDPDRQGHGDNWDTNDYLDAVAAVDGYIGNILSTVETDPGLAGETIVIVTADHGGAGNVHSDASDAENYTVPFYVWGAGVAAGSDLYALNPTSRINPGATRPDYTTSPQPIRNGDIANLALGCLGLPPIPDGSINDLQDLNIAPLASPPFALAITRASDQIQLDWDDLGGSSTYTVEVNNGTAWTAAPGSWPIGATNWIDPSPINATRIYRVKADR